MIRISDLSNAAAWSRPVGNTPRVDSDNPSAWFSADSVGADVRLSGDVSPDSRGLTVDQHAARVLAALCGDQDRDA